MFIRSAHAAGLPIAATEVAVKWDVLYSFLVWLSIFFGVLVLGAMVYFAIFHRRGAGHRTKYITGSHVLETLWTAIPTVLLLGIFAWGYMVYNEMTQAPDNAMEIKVLAKQWVWQFQYDDGRTTIGKVYVPVNKPVKFLMTSEDVLHSMFIPNFRVKQDVVPGMYTSVWFQSTVPGRHQIFCTEYCGASHSLMLADLNVLTDSQWAQFKKGKDVGPIPEAGSKLAQAELKQNNDAIRMNAALPLRSLAEQGREVARVNGCVACHSADGSPKIGPSYKGLFGHTQAMADGSKILADENYFRESIVNPEAKIVKGYRRGMMPTFKGQISEPDMNALIAYLKSLK